MKQTLCCQVTNKVLSWMLSPVLLNLLQQIAFFSLQKWMKLDFFLELSGAHRLFTSHDFVSLPSLVSSVLPGCPHVCAWWSGPICAQTPADPCRPETQGPAHGSTQRKHNNLMLDFSYPGSQIYFTDTTWISLKGLSRLGLCKGVHCPDSRTLSTLMSRLL